MVGLWLDSEGSSCEWVSVKLAAAIGLILVRTTVVVGCCGSADLVVWGVREAWERDTSEC